MLDNEENVVNFFPINNTKTNGINNSKQIETAINHKRERSPNDSTSEKKEEKKHQIKKLKLKNNISIGNKRQICQFYINGACKKGNNCPFSHNSEQIHKKELCKFYLSKSCSKGELCLYSHNLSDFPCKFYHARGFCDNFENCKFSHSRLRQDEIQKFISDNEEFLIETKKKFGRTNMDDFFNKYMKSKQKGINDAMLPEELRREKYFENDSSVSNNNYKTSHLVPLGFYLMSANHNMINVMNQKLKEYLSNQDNNNQKKKEIIKEDKKQSDKSLNDIKIIDPFQKPSQIDEEFLNEIINNGL